LTTGLATTNDMNTFAQLMHCDGSTDRLTYQRNIAVLAFGKSTVDLLAITLAPITDTGLIALAWLNPFVLVRPWWQGTMPLAICLSTFVFFSALVWNSVHRARHAGWPHGLGLLAALPFVNIAAAVLFAWVPERKRSVWDLV
jgi:hypothetical protein